MKTISLALISALLYTLAAAAPADIPETVHKVGDHPDRELFGKRAVIANPKAPVARAVVRKPWAEVVSSISSASSSSAAAARTVITRTAAAPTTRTTTTTTRATTTTTRPTTTTRASSTTAARPTTVIDGNPIATQSAQLPATTSTSAAAPGSTLGADIRAAVLNEHNTFRAQHAAPPLVWDQALADSAASWANRCVFQHSQGAVGPYGENLAASAGSGVTVQTAISGIKAWEAEAPEYDPSNPIYSHFTQMVWKATTKLGCYQANCPAGSIFDARYGVNSYLVCEYSPPGNVYPASNFLINVTP
ncbi:hypothetical protein JCM10450v2_006528 [Rhodotorula kratochvilovae]